MYALVAFLDAACADALLAGLGSLYTWVLCLAALAADLQPQTISVITSV